MKRFQHQLVEGKVYALSNFMVWTKMKCYMACRNGLMIYMGGQTVVDEISDGTGSSIPLHSFEFVDFGNVPSRNRDNSLFTGRCFGELILHLQLVFASRFIHMSELALLVACFWQMSLVRLYPLKKRGRLVSWARQRLLVTFPFATYICVI